MGRNCCGGARLSLPAGLRSLEPSLGRIKHVPSCSERVHKTINVPVSCVKGPSREQDKIKYQFKLNLSDEFSRHENNPLVSNNKELPIKLSSGSRPAVCCFGIRRAGADGSSLQTHPVIQIFRPPRDSVKTGKKTKNKEKFLPPAASCLGFGALSKREQRRGRGSVWTQLWGE